MALPLKQHKYLSRVKKVSKSIQDFQQLRQLRTRFLEAVTNQEFHKLAQIDDCIRDTVEALVPVVKGNSKLSEVLSLELKNLKSVYREAGERCAKRSLELKVEYNNALVSKKSAIQYLDVAGR